MSLERNIFWNRINRIMIIIYNNKKSKIIHKFKSNNYLIQIYNSNKLIKIVN